MDQPKDIVFYHAPQSRSLIVHWMLEEVGQPYDLKLVNLKVGEQRQSEYLSINPMGKVPALSHRGVIITEAAAICCYLADAFSHTNLAVPIGDPGRGQYLKWLFFGPSCLEPAVIDRMLNRQDGAVGMLGYGNLDATLGVLARAVKQGPYLMGCQFTAADVVIGSGLRWGMAIDVIPTRPEFVAYDQRLGERPALQRVMEKNAELSG